MILWFDRYPTKTQKRTVPACTLWSIHYAHNCVMMTSGRAMMTSWHGNVFRVTGRLWGESTSHRWIPLIKGQWHGNTIFDVSFNVSLNKRLDITGDFRRHDARCDVTVMVVLCGALSLLYHNLCGFMCYFTYMLASLPITAPVSMT